jgi:hypothetical protein
MATVPESVPAHMAPGPEASPARTAGVHDAIADAMAPMSPLEVDLLSDPALD